RSPVELLPAQEPGSEGSPDYRSGQGDRVGNAVQRVFRLVTGAGTNPPLAAALERAIAALAPPADLRLPRPPSRALRLFGPPTAWNRHRFLRTAARSSRRLRCHSPRQ